jgi:hypothetical protein
MMCMHMCNMQEPDITREEDLQGETADSYPAGRGSRTC